MPKKADKLKEEQFVNYFTDGNTQGNATKSAEKAGWTKTPAQMGAYLKRKLQVEIREKNEERIQGTSSKAISVLQSLLNSEQDSVRLNTAKLVLELGNYSQQTINLNVDNSNNKTDEELVLELKDLLKEVPSLKTVEKQIEGKQPIDVITEKTTKSKLHH